MPQRQVDTAWWATGSHQGRPMPEILRERDVAAVFDFLHGRGWSWASIGAACGISETRVRAVASRKQVISSYEVFERVADGFSIDRGLMGLAFGETKQQLATAVPRPAPREGDRSVRAVAPPASAEHPRHPAAVEDLGPSSSARTKVLLDAIGPLGGPRLRYHPPAGAAGRFREFLASPSRVFVTTGPTGSGKTVLTYFLAGELAADADVQVHSVNSWRPTDVDLAVEILRYASIPRGDDALLTLEQASSVASRPVVVVVDGVASRDWLHEIARQVDGALRQVASGMLRFLLVVRTPPEVELSAYPILAASTYEQPVRAHGASYQSPASYRMSEWNLVDAGAVWDRSRSAGQPAFADMPVSVQRLARIPLYTRLLITAGHGKSPGEITSYRLVDHCVRAILAQSSADPHAAAAELANHARRSMPGLIPPRPLERVDQAMNVDQTAVMAHAAAPPPGTWAPGWPELQHDVIREYFLARQIAATIVDRGRTVATVAAFNDLARQAASSATARGLFEFVLCCLDDDAPDLLAALILAPTINVDTTLPLVFNVAGPARFATGEVLRACADRCLRDSALELARSLVGTPAVRQTLEDAYPRWVIDLLRRFGFAIWADVLRAVELLLDMDVARRLMACADLSRAGEAVLFARYFYLFDGDGRDETEALAAMLGHPDWRVRAALAEGLTDERSAGHPVISLIVDRLVRDSDYKVRAAVARAIQRADPEVRERYLTMLLTDANWHVRQSALLAVTASAGAAADSALAGAAVGVITTDETWARCPAHIDVPAQRLLLIHEHGGTTASPAREQALFMLLRETRTGWIRPPIAVQRRLTVEGQRSRSWLVRREAEAAATGTAVTANESYRRLRDRRSVQVALDLHDLDHAVTVAAAAGQEGADLIEVGDPLIKRCGLAAIERVKQAVPTLTVVAEMMSADWGRDQVELAAGAGADVVFLIGPATTASVAAAVEAGRRLGVAVVLDAPARDANPEWVRDMERAGVDGFTVTTNIDHGIGGQQPLATAQAIHGWTRLPVAASGGFSVTDRAAFDLAGCDIVIVGRGIAEALDPASAARQLVTAVHNRRPGRPHDRHTAAS